MPFISEMFKQISEASDRSIYVHDLSAFRASQLVFFAAPDDIFEANEVYWNNQSHKL